MRELEQLIADAELFKKYYYKGAGNLLCGIYGAADIVLHYEEHKKEMLDHMSKSITEFETNYPLINFDEIRGKDAFAPLFVIDKLRPEFKEAVDEFTKAPSSDTYAHLTCIFHAIITVGDLYRNAFTETVNKIRTHPRLENYTVFVKNPRTGKGAGM